MFKVAVLHLNTDRNRNARKRANNCGTCALNGSQLNNSVASLSLRLIPCSFRSNVTWQAVHRKGGDILCQPLCSDHRSRVLRVSPWTYKSSEGNNSHILSLWSRSQSNDARRNIIWPSFVFCESNFNNFLGNRLLFHSYNMKKEAAGSSETFALIYQSTQLFNCRTP
jgi:hypothetical protein